MYLLEDQDAITVFDFKTKLELQISGIGCEYVPRYMAQRFIESGVLVEKPVVFHMPFVPVWIGWNEQKAGLASECWRQQIVSSAEIATVYGSCAK